MPQQHSHKEEAPRGLAPQHGSLQGQLSQNIGTLEGAWRLTFFSFLHEKS